MNSLPPEPRLLIEGNVAAAAPFVGIAKKLAKRAYLSGIRAKTWQVAAGVVVRVENYLESRLSKVFIKVAKKEELYAFIFLPKFIYLYRHPNASESPWPLPDSIPVLPTADTNTNQYQAKYQYFPPKPPKTDWKAAVKLLDKNYRYGNQNFLYKNDIYSWWHSTGGDLPVSVYHPEMFVWTTALDISVFPVNEVDGASITKSSLERLPCYTHGMTVMRWVDDKGFQSDPLYLFGYFVEADDRYYWYQQKPILYKNNKPLYDYSDGIGFITFICGFYKGDVVFRDETTHTIEIIVYQSNPYLTPGDVNVYALVKDITDGVSFQENLYTILGGPLIMNGLNWPIRFSEDGKKMAGLFHCAEGGNRATGYVNEHLRLVQFSIDYVGEKITRTDSERFIYNSVASGVTPLTTTSFSTNTSTEINLSFNTKTDHADGPCTWNEGQEGLYFKRDTDQTSTTNETRNKNQESELSGLFVIAASYKNNDLIKAQVELMYNSDNDASVSIVDISGITAEVWSRQGVSTGTILAPWPQDSANTPRVITYEGNRQYINNICYGYTRTNTTYGGIDSQSSMRRGSQQARLDQSTLEYTQSFILKLPNNKEIPLLENTSIQETLYTRQYYDATSHPTNRSYDDDYSNNLDGGYGSYTGSRRNLGESTVSEAASDWVVTRYSFVGIRDTKNSVFERTDTFVFKQLSYLNLADEIMISFDLSGEYQRAINSSRIIKTTTGDLATGVNLTGEPVTYTSVPYNESLDISESTGVRQSRQTLAIALRNYGINDDVKYLGEEQVAEREDVFSNELFINAQLTLPETPEFSSEQEYDFLPNTIFSFMGMGSSLGAAARKHKDINNSIYLVGVFYQGIKFYYGEQDSYYGSYFPPVNEFYSYQLKGVDTNVPPHEGASLQDPVNPDDINIGNQLCPIGFLKT